MASMIRRLMRGIRKSSGTQSSRMSGSVMTGSTRAGMHQKAESEYRRVKLTETEPVPETAEEALDIPAELEDKIPPEEDPAEDIAEEEAVIEPDEEILEEVAEEVVEEPQEEPEGETVQLSVDYSGDLIPELQPVSTEGKVSADTELVYSPGDGSLKEIQDPLPGMERHGVEPQTAEIENPSANTAEAPEPEDQPEENPEVIEPEG